MGSTNHEVFFLHRETFIMGVTFSKRTPRGGQKKIKSTFTFTSCDSRPCSRASMSLLDPRRFRELMLPYCLLSWARQLAPIYLMCMTTQEFFMSPV